MYLNNDQQNLNFVLDPGLQEERQKDHHEFPNSMNKKQFSVHCARTQNGYLEIKTSEDFYMIEGIKF